ncbi:MAG TPA: hypothetical protein VMV69_18605, partial [Pirellulales bacterium]|nr:hypothetical protein [Pirellulales bacterium]
PNRPTCRRTAPRRSTNTLVDPQIAQISPIHEGAWIGRRRMAGPSLPAARGATKALNRKAKALNSRGKALNWRGKALNWRGKALNWRGKALNWRARPSRLTNRGLTPGSPRSGSARHGRAKMAGRRVSAPRRASGPLRARRDA